MPKKPSPHKMMNDLARGMHEVVQPKDDPDNDGDSHYSDKAEEVIGNKMHKMKNEDRPQKQKVAIALSEARSKGLKVPTAKK